MFDILQGVLDYLKSLSPKRAFLHVLTVLCLVVIFRYSQGDYDDYFIVLKGTDKKDEDIHALRTTYAPIFMRYEPLLKKLLVTTNGQRVSMFMYHTDYKYTSGTFKALQKSLVDTMTLSLDPDRKLVLELFSNVPVIYNEELEVLLKNQCYVNNPLDSFYLETMVKIVGTEGFIGVPLEDLSGKLVGFITLSFGDLPENTDSLNTLSCASVQEIVNEIEKDTEFIRATNGL